MAACDWPKRYVFTDFLNIIQYFIFQFFNFFYYWYHTEFSKRKFPKISLWYQSCLLFWKTSNPSAHKSNVFYEMSVKLIIIFEYLDIKYIRVYIDKL